MHELSLAAAIVDIACRRVAATPELRVSKVYVQVGHLRQVVPSALSFSFELVAMGTAAEGAALELELIPAVGVCRQCTVESVLTEFPLQCARCRGFDLNIVAGEELEVEALELENRVDETSGKLLNQPGESSDGGQDQQCAQLTDRQATAGR
ncbi:MAG: hydrogenase maturation nickel metallochaperone HypA [Chloroflexota bacterium]